MRRTIVALRWLVALMPALLPVAGEAAAPATDGAPRLVPEPGYRPHRHPGVEPTAGVVKLSNDAFITDGKNEIRGPLLTYNIRAQHVEAVSQSDKDDRVHITINPNQEERPNK